MTRSICDAIDAGYRHIDGAAFYQNEEFVGRGIHQKIREGVVQRKDLFVVSKVSCLRFFLSNNPKQRSDFVMQKVVAHVHAAGYGGADSEEDP